jgi:hypothetical protein
MRATERAGRRAQPIVGAIVGLALLLQLALAPLHLVRHDHLGPLASAAQLPEHAELDHGHHVHGAHGHDHDRRPSEQPEPDRGPGHAPHPAADHFDLVGEAATPPSGGQLDLALAPQAGAVCIRPVPESASLDVPESCPRPPPPRDAASPRAPPVAT